METTASELATKSNISEPNEVTKENQELRDLCCFLDDERKKSKKLAQEWQSFGKYTASILRNEVLGFEKKLTILQENLQKLSQENAELRDLCLFLNQMSGLTGNTNTKGANTDPPKLDTPQVQEYAAHAACVSQMNQVLEDVPQYTGFTGEEKLADIKQEQPTTVQQVPTTQDKKEEQQSVSNGEYVSQLEKRLERLEREKLELIKSLSAAHILAANANENKDLPNSTMVQEETEVKEPPDIKAFLDFIKENGITNENQKDANEGDIQDNGKKKDFTLDEILKLSTLIDISKRLDAMDNNSNLSIKETNEIATLRMLITVAFKQLQSGDSSSNSYSTSPSFVHTEASNSNNTETFIVPQHGGVIQTEV